MKKYFLISILFFHFVYAAEDISCGKCETSNGKIEKLNTVIDDITCSKPAIGEAIEVGSGHGDYRVTEISPKRYEVQINPIFYAPRLGGPESLWSFSRRSSEEQKKYTQKMNECFALIAPFLKGPGGETLEIRAIKDEKLKPANIQIAQVTNDMDLDRSDASRYLENINCPTILHEALHLLGLEDEYPERRFGIIKDPLSGSIAYARKNAQYVGFDCRAIGPADSIMNNSEAGFLSVLPTVKKDATTCICTKSEARCEKAIVDNKDLIWNKNMCPPGFDIQTMEIDGATVEDEKKYFGREPEGKVTFQVDQQGFTSFDLVPVIKSKPRKPMKSTLLMPAHFRMITRPDCNSLNARYMECTAGAYQNSNVHRDCKLKADKCQANTDWLL